MENYLVIMMERQMQTSRALAAQEDSAWDLLNMVAHLAKTVQEQEHKIVSLTKLSLASHARALHQERLARAKQQELEQLQLHYEACQKEVTSLRETVKRLAVDLGNKNEQLQEHGQGQGLSLQKTVQKHQQQEQQTTLQKQDDEQTNLRQKKLAQENRLYALMDLVRGGGGGGGGGHERLHTGTAGASEEPQHDLETIVRETITRNTSFKSSLSSDLFGSVAPTECTQEASMLSACYTIKKKNATTPLQTIVGVLNRTTAQMLLQHHQSTSQPSLLSLSLSSDNDDDSTTQ